MTDTETTRLLAEKVMGWVVIGPNVALPDSVCTGQYAYVDQYEVLWRWHAAPRLQWLPWRPLQSMDDAMQIVEHLRTRTTGQRYWCEMRTPFQDGDRYLAGFTIWAFTGWNGRPDFHALADSLPRAICEAAILTLEASDV